MFRKNILSISLLLLLSSHDAHACAGCAPVVSSVALGAEAVIAAYKTGEVAIAANVASIAQKTGQLDAIQDDIATMNKQIAKLESRNALAIDAIGASSDKANALSSAKIDALLLQAQTLLAK